jgi:hypothetical protein
VSSAPLTSVVTVSFNSGRQLARCVRSVLASTVPVELVVVDNGSRDDGLERLRAGLAPGERRVRLIENPANLGFARANNQALAGTRGCFLLFLNPDCVIEPDTIERMQRALASRPEVGMAGPLIANPDGSEQAGCRRERPLPGRAFVRAFALEPLLRRLGWRTAALRDFVPRGEALPSEPIEVDAISGAFMFVRREALRAVGPLDEGYFLHCEDLDWCERFRRAGRSILFVPDVRIVHDKGGSSRDRPVRVLWHMHRGMVRYYRKFFRGEYPLALMGLVLVGVWLRFGVLATIALARRGLSRVRDR